jgi:hypothetical protein
MPFVSYAQNYEDVILWRAFRDLERGFYVDVGAADPEALSGTHAFYGRGWSGMNAGAAGGVRRRPFRHKLNRSSR